MRLDYYVANATGLSRKEAKREIGAGRVTVDGEPCRRGNQHLRADQQVAWQGRSLSLPGERYLMLNKPAGIVSATEDRDHQTVTSLVPPELRAGLHPVGRLDRDTTGLLLLTSDGQWSHRITSPRTGCPKTYRVTLAEPLPAEALARLEAGVLLRDEDRPTAPARVLVQSERVIDLVITEGRYHQVKRMLAAVGNHVIALHRTRVGGIELDPELAPGQWRPLTQAEIDSVG